MSRRILMTFCHLNFQGTTPTRWSPRKQVGLDKHLSAYTVRAVGTRPTNGWPLFIAMHGGGGAPKELNDSQWEQMKRYYKDHSEEGGYLYLALRAPNDTWNGFYDVYVY